MTRRIPEDVLDRATKAVAQCFARMAGDATIKRHLDVMYGSDQGEIRDFWKSCRTIARAALRQEPKKL